MAAFRHWRVGAKIVALSAAAMLLSFGLCATGRIDIDASGRMIQGFQIRAGIVLFLVAVLGLLVGSLTLALGLFGDGDR